MRVHIVYQSGGHVIDRLAEQLLSSRGTCGWTTGKQPDPQADLNYFFPYLDLACLYPNFNETPIACYFSHYEENDARKAAWWSAAAERADFGVVTARQYADMLDIPTALAHPPVDDQFVFGKRRQNEKPVVGVAGVVQKESGRKGETLVRKLYSERNDIAIRAIGRGWPVRCAFIDWQNLPDFYRAIDVFLCASSVEGVPMTVLEAAACGTPCVVPVGVGMLDDLPDVDGLYRYRAGNYRSMERAIDAAIEGGGNALALRAAVGGYSVETWQMDHLSAFERFLYDVPSAGEDVPWSKDNAGLYMVAFGSPARQCAVTAIETFKAHMDLPVALVSNEPLGPEDIFIQHEDSDIGARRAKLSVERLAPEHWRHILYLDADTETVADISFIFNLLADGWEFVICKNPDKYHVFFNGVRPDQTAEFDETFSALGTDEALQLNGGVWAYRRTPRTRCLMQNWLREWDRWGKRDQPSLHRALYERPVRTYVLGNEWNCIDRYYDVEQVSAGINHYPMRARRHPSFKVVQGRLDSEEAWRIVREAGH